MLPCLCIVKQRRDESTSKLQAVLASYLMNFAERVKVYVVSANPHRYQVIAKHARQATCLVQRELVASGLREPKIESPARLVVTRFLHWFFISARTGTHEFPITCGLFQFGEHIEALRREYCRNDQLRKSLEAFNRSDEGVQIVVRSTDATKVSTMVWRIGVPWEVYHGSKSFPNSAALSRTLLLPHREWVFQIDFGIELIDE